MSRTPSAGVDVGVSSDVPELGRLVVDVDDRTIGIFRVEGRLYAYDNVCPHQGGPVCQGRIMPKVRERIEDHLAKGMEYDRSEMHLVCPWHGAEFVITTGQHASTAAVALSPVEVTEEGGHIRVHV
ncbi:Rieske (2Fe-2S) protein [Barrientosiimonas humi]|uniref:Rieske (2Fe-2S) protein n=1 Tax=Barrientosiimonas humi TaxID=999931 RepID=UPI00370D2E42